jgi:hypothetical protein
VAKVPDHLWRVKFFAGEAIEPNPYVVMEEMVLFYQQINGEDG